LLTLVSIGLAGCITLVVTLGGTAGGITKLGAGTAGLTNRSEGLLDI